MGSPYREGLRERRQYILISHPREDPLHRRWWKGMARCWKFFYEHQHTFPSLLEIPLTTPGMSYSDSPPLELKVWQQSSTTHSKRKKGARPPRYSTPTHKHFQKNEEEGGKYFSRRRKCLRKEIKAMILSGNDVKTEGDINTRLNP